VRGPEGSTVVLCDWGTAASIASALPTGGSNFTSRQLRTWDWGCQAEHRLKVCRTLVVFILIALIGVALFLLFCVVRLAGGTAGRRSHPAQHVELTSRDL